MKWAPISAGIGIGMVMSLALGGGMGAAQSRSSSAPAERKVSAERETSVRIAPTSMRANSTSIDVGADHWIARGFDVKTLIAEIYDVDVRRIDIRDNQIGDAKYDLSLTLPREVDEADMQRMLEDGLERKLGVTIAPESRTLDVYVLTAPNGPGQALHPHRATAMTLDSAQPASDGAQQIAEDAQQITFLGKDCEGVSSGGITASAGTLGEFRRTLEPGLDRLLIDETGLDGSYDFQIGSYRSQQQLFQLLREQLGIAVTPERRDVTVLTVRPRQELQAAM